MLINRDLIEKIAPFLKRKEFISITGPRQCGKSTFLILLRKYISETLKIDLDLMPILTFENNKLLAQFEENPTAFIRSYMQVANRRITYIFIDEFQYAEEGGQKLK
jgi:predicted AAA+ superfamily ATPase